MQVKLKLRPGDWGTKKLTKRYRDKLVSREKIAKIRSPLALILP